MPQRIVQLAYITGRPARVGPGPGSEGTGARNEVRLVGVQEWVGQAVADPDETQRRGEDEDRAERYAIRAHSE